jgi:hypothetical protein
MCGLRPRILEWGRRSTLMPTGFIQLMKLLSFFNSESSAYKIEAGIVIRNPLYIYGNGHMVTIFEKGINDVGKKLDSDMLKKALG